MSAPLFTKKETLSRMQSGAFLSGKLIHFILFCFILICFSEQSITPSFVRFYSLCSNFIAQFMILMNWSTHSFDAMTKKKLNSFSFFLFHHLRITSVSLIWYSWIATMMIFCINYLSEFILGNNDIFALRYTEE